MNVFANQWRGRWEGGGDKNCCANGYYYIFIKVYFGKQDKYRVQYEQDEIADF